MCVILYSVTGGIVDLGGAAKGYSTYKFEGKEGSGEVCEREWMCVS